MVTCLPILGGAPRLGDELEAPGNGAYPGGLLNEGFPATMSSGDMISISYLGMDTSWWLLCIKWDV